MNFPNNKYQIIYADPPWEFNKGVYQDNGRKDRFINDQYPTMNKKELQQLSVKEITQKDCALFMWSTDNHLKEAIELMELWGFTYRTIAFIWKKVTKNGKTCATVGSWVMKNCEICLFGAKGNMLKYKRVNNIYQIIEAERTKHSKKPEETRKRIELLFGDLPRIELFAREQVEGWDTLGDEIDSMDMRESLGLLGEYFKSLE